MWKNAILRGTIDKKLTRDHGGRGTDEGPAVDGRSMHRRVQVPRSRESDFITAYAKYAKE